MIEILIPNYKKLELRYLIADFNGTLAEDGIIIKGVEEKLTYLSKLLEIYVITADTFGKAKEQLKSVNCQLVVLENLENQSFQKLEFLNKFDKQHVVAIGNGANDILLLKNAELSIGVINKEGVFSEVIKNCQIICNNIIDALDLLINPKRLVATLRR